MSSINVSVWYIGRSQQIGRAMLVPLLVRFLDAVVDWKGMDPSRQKGTRFFAAVKVSGPR